tara:strand:- start:268 stop:558 length:291 start_codon:yes stop_codon:yes gene_type:complete
MENTIVFKISDKNDFSKLNFSKNVNNFIADLSDVDISVIDLLKDKFITFEKIVYKNKGSFVIVCSINFDEDLNIVPTLQEAYDFIDMEEIERQLEL